MYETLFHLEALLKAASDLAFTNPLLVSNSDIGTLQAITQRVVNRADRAVAAGHQRPEAPLPFAIGDKTI